MSGAILGTILVMGGSEWLRFLDQDMDIFHPGLRMVVFSILLIILMLFARKGLFGDKELTEVFKRVKK